MNAKVSLASITQLALIGGYYHLNVSAVLVTPAGLVKSVRLLVICTE